MSVSPQHVVSEPNQQSKEATPDTEQDEAAWKRAHQLHGGNFVRLVANRLPSLEWIYCLMGSAGVSLESSSQPLGYRISIAEVHRMHLRYLQIKLINVSVSLQFHSDNHSIIREDIGKLLREYIQDYEYMVKTSQESYDFFVASAERFQDRDLLECALRAQNDAELILRKYGITPTGPWERPKLVSHKIGHVDAAQDQGDAENQQEHVSEQWESYFTSEPIGSTRTTVTKRFLRTAFWQRTGEAALRGTFIIGPMWLLSLKQDLMFQLGVTTICVAAFGIILAWLTSVPGQVFSAMLAYAAVLMVFIGVMVQNSDVKT